MTGDRRPGKGQETRKPARLQVESGGQPEQDYRRKLVAHIDRDDESGSPNSALEWMSV